MVLLMGCSSSLCVCVVSVKCLVKCVLVMLGCMLNVVIIFVCCRWVKCVLCDSGVRFWVMCVVVM